MAIMSISDLTSCNLRRNSLTHQTAINRSFLVLSLAQADQTLIKSAMTKLNSKIQAGIHDWVLSKSDLTYRYINPADAFNAVLDNYKQYGALNSSCYIAQDPSCLWVSFLVFYDPRKRLTMLSGTTSILATRSMRLLPTRLPNTAHSRSSSTSTNASILHII